MKINYTKIAETAGVSKQALSNILNGRRRPSWGTAKRLAFVTKTNPVLWLEGTPVEIKKAIDLFKKHPSKALSAMKSKKTTGAILCNVLSVCLGLEVEK